MKITSEQLFDLLILDYRKQENKEKIRKALYNIKPFKKYKEGNEEVPFNDLEKLIELILKKYMVRIQWLSPTILDNKQTMWWSVSLKRDDNHAWLGSLNGYCLYEILAKVSIKLYVITREQGEDAIPLREEEW